MSKGNFTTGAERRNKRMNKIFDDYRSIKEKESKMSYKELILDGYGKETAKYIINQRKQNKFKKGLGVHNAFS